MRTLTEDKRKTVLSVVLIISCFFCIMTCAVGCKEETPVQNTPTFKEKYIDDFRRIGAKSGEEPYQYGAKIDTLATQMGLDYTDRTMTLMHVYKFDDVYIYDEYLKVYLYLYSKCSDTKEIIEIEDLLAEYENESDEIMEGKLMVFHQKGGDNLTYHYLIELSKVYALYEEQTGEQIQGKELKELELEDYIKLEEWAFDNANRDEFPTIFQVNNSFIRTSLKSSDVMNMAIIPAEYRYMFESCTCDRSLPDNSQIKRIALTKYNKHAENSGAWLVLYALVDCDNSKLIYGKSSKLDTIAIVQEIELSEDETQAYKNAVNPACLVKPIESDNAYWKIAIEYNNGTCYSYEFEKECNQAGSPENNMIKTYFDKMDLETYDRKIAAIWTPETDE